MAVCQVFLETAFLKTKEIQSYQVAMMSSNVRRTSLSISKPGK